MRFWIFLVLLSLLAIALAAPHKEKDHESEHSEHSETKHKGGKLKGWAKKLKKFPLLPPPPPPLYPMVQPLFINLPFYVQSPKYQYVPVPVELPSYVKGYYGGGVTGYANGPLSMYNQNGPPPM